jgi:uncharacterized protein
MQTGYVEVLQRLILEQARPVDKFGHQPRLQSLTLAIGHGLHYDEDVVCAAAWLHDLGVFIGHRPEDEAALKTWDHVAYITEKAPAILEEAGFPTKKIPAVLEVIRTHQPHDTPITLEAKIARDADILEQLGAIGITRTLAKLGSDTRFNTFTDALHALKKQLEILPSKLHLEASKKLAALRIELMRSFIQSLESEGGQNLY